MMELFVAWIPLLALVGLALTIWCLYQRFRRAALGWAAATALLITAYARLRRTAGTQQV